MRDPHPQRQAKCEDPKLPLKKIMVVEDHPDIREIVTIALGLGGYSVQACASGPEALETAPDMVPQLILLDVRMPEMDGLQTLQKLRMEESLGQVLVVFMTAKVQASDLDDYRKMGAADVIMKPFDPMRLPVIVESIWERHHGRS